MEPVSLTIITDSDEEKAEINEALVGVKLPGHHQCHVYSLREADERAAVAFSRYPHIAQFRKGHPCWRKITDPVLYSAQNDEMIILDPDLYFPNKFRFEPSAESGLLLMWQPPSCLLPDAVVMQEYQLGIKLAHHVDIGVAQLRNNIDLEWLDWLIGALGGSTIPRAMHVEAIVWSALAMRMGGGYLDRTAWYCWQYRQWKRLALKLGISGVALLRREPLDNVKCFHASGVAKWFVKEACERGLFAAPRTIPGNSTTTGYIELPQHEYLADQRLKRLVRNLGYYRLMGVSG